ncbi:MAG: hypothetical protein IK099_01455 [Clostridia bacterium]|nr:hypothetical protein [Clostridia bacterium]
MKRYLLMILALALIFSLSAGIAEAVHTEEYLVYQGEEPDVPDLSIFAKLNASTPDKNDRVTVTLSAPVDRLWANWMGKDEKPEELYLNSQLSATFSTKGHPYQVGALPPTGQSLTKEESSQRFIIEFGALDSQINWRKIQAQNAAAAGECVQVVDPQWILVRVEDGEIMGKYDDSLNCTDIEVPHGYKLEKVDGYAVAWHWSSQGSNGYPNLAYITLQKGYVVIYGRNGTIQSVMKYSPDLKVFGIEMGTTADDTGWEKVLSSYYVCKNVSEYSGLPELPPISSFAQIDAVNSGDGKSIVLYLNKQVDHLWANWMGKGEEPEELTVSANNRAVVSTNGHKYQVGTQWVGEIAQGETGKRQKIVWGAYPSYIDWAVGQVKQGSDDPGYVKVVLPHWEVQEITTGSVAMIYDDSINCTDISVPKGYKLVKKEGYAVAYNTQGINSDGSPNLAYIAEQDGWTVYYNRAGQIVMVTRTVPNSSFFEVGTGTATVQYEKSEFGQWMVSRITEVYPDNRSITAIYSRYGTGDLEDYQVSNF